MYGYIYLWTNKINGHHYVGQHKYNKLEFDPNYLTGGKLIQAKIKEYGIENFERTMLDTADTLEELNEAEKYWINEFESYIDWHKGGYNLTLGGDGVEALCGESKDRMIESNKKTWNDLEHKQFAREIHKGLKASEETKKKMSESRKGRISPMKGKKMTEETKKKISEANSGEKNGFYGKHHSEETRQHWSEIRKGKKHSEETKKKMSELQSGEKNGFYGKYHSEEAKKKMSEAKKGKPSGRKGKKTKQYNWKTPDGDIIQMDKSNAKRHHPDWVLVE